MGPLVSLCAAIRLVVCVSESSSVKFAYRMMKAFFNRSANDEIHLVTAIPSEDARCATHVAMCLVQRGVGDALEATTQGARYSEPLGNPNRQLGESHPPRCECVWSHTLWHAYANPPW